jgi:hypothetical protein
MEIDLSFNEFGEEGAMAIAAMIAQNKSLTSMNLCELGETCFERICAALVSNFSIVTIHTDFIFPDVDAMLARNREIKTCHFEIK